MSGPLQEVTDNSQVISLMALTHVPQHRWRYLCIYFGLYCVFVHSGYCGCHSVTLCIFAFLDSVFISVIFYSCQTGEEGEAKLYLVSNWWTLITECTHLAVLNHVLPFRSRQWNMGIIPFYLLCRKEMCFGFFLFFSRYALHQKALSLFTLVVFSLKKFKPTFR